jgi:hypothetical protein
LAGSCRRHEVAKMVFTVLCRLVGRDPCPKLEL